MDERVGMARTRELGNRLRRIREAAGISGGQLADRLGWSSSKVSRIETGMTGVAELDVVRMAAHSGASIEEMDALLDLCREPGAPGFWLSSRLASLVFHESTAGFSSSYDPLVVPGMLQTEEYATALIGGEDLLPENARNRVAARMERQRLLHRRGFEFFIHQQALRLPVGGNRVMNEQLLKLVLVSEQPKITIRVVPTALGERTVFGGEFVLFRHSGHRPLVYVPSVGLFLEERDRVARYKEKLARLSEVALGKGESRELLAALASEFDLPEDPPDAPDHLAKEQFQLGI
jgi:transcriptional regulator with XRE-family HTH domain